jgi:hypothetical protein
LNFQHGEGIILQSMRLSVSPQRLAGDRFILFGSLLSCLGWILALLGEFNHVAYGIGFAVLVCGFLWLEKGWFESRSRTWSSEWCRFRRRIRRPVFILYLFLWLGALAGGALYSPSNYDALSYRIPQLLHWVSEGRWHWIDAANSRMNIAPPGMNWLIAPLYFLTKSDRSWFIINLAAFTFLPGYLFEFFRRAGVSRRNAWWFMWLVPCGYGFALQAGSLGNDLLGATMAVSAIALAFRAMTSHRATDLWLSGMAMGFATGVKTVNLPLLIPWLIAVLPSMRLVARRPLGSLAALVVAAFASCLPTICLNIRERGTWTGDPLDEHRVRQPNPIVGLASNTIPLLVSYSQPPLLQNPLKWNQLIEARLTDTKFGALCAAGPRFEVRWTELPTEELAALGPGIVFICGLCLGTALTSGRPALRHRFRNGWGVALGGWLAFLLLLARFSSEAIGRLSIGFAPFLILSVLLVAGSSNCFRRRHMRWMAVAAGALSIPPMLLSPSRPLVPVMNLLKMAGQERVGRAAEVYSTYAERPDCYRALLAKLGPIKASILWFAGGGDDPEAPAWKPYGSRVVQQWTALGNTSGEVNHPQNRIALVSDLGVRERFGVDINEFKTRVGATALAEAELKIRAGRGAERWYLLQIPGTFP